MSVYVQSLGAVAVRWKGGSCAIGAKTFARRPDRRRAGYTAATPINRNPAGDDHAGVASFLAWRGWMEGGTFLFSFPRCAHTDGSHGNKKGSERVPGWSLIGPSLWPNPSRHGRRRPCPCGRCGGLQRPTDHPSRWRCLAFSGRRVGTPASKWTPAPRPCRGRFFKKTHIVRRHVQWAERVKKQKYLFIAITENKKTAKARSNRPFGKQRKKGDRERGET